MAMRKGFRYESRRKLCGWPIFSLAIGPDPSKGEMRGWARGIVAVGNIATGVFAFGGLAGGGIAIGGISVGGLAVGGVSLGGLIIAGVAIGYVAFGGVAVGYYAKGGTGGGKYVETARRHDPEAVRFFNRLTPGATP